MSFDLKAIYLTTLVIYDLQCYKLARILPMPPETSSELVHRALCHLVNYKNFWLQCRFFFRAPIQILTTFDSSLKFMNFDKITAQGCLPAGLTLVKSVCGGRPH